MAKNATITLPNVFALIGEGDGSTLSAILTAVLYGDNTP